MEEFAAHRAGEDFAADPEWVEPAEGIADPIATEKPGATQGGPPANEEAAERDRLRKLAEILEPAPEPPPAFPLPDPAIPAAEAVSSALDIAPEPLGLPDMAALNSAPEPLSEESALDVVPQRTAAITSAAPAVPPPAARIAQQPQKPSRRRDFASFAPRRQRLAAPRQQWRLPRPGLPAAILMLAAAMAALIAGRSEIVRHAPQTASLYAAIGMPVNLRRLDFDGVKTARENHNGIPVLVVEGNIVSNAAKPVDVPQLHFAIRNPGGLEIYRWTASPDRPTLAPGEQMAFRSRLAAPPPESSEVIVRFLGRHDEVAGLQ